MSEQIQEIAATHVSCHREGKGVEGRAGFVKEMFCYIFYYERIIVLMHSRKQKLDLNQIKLYDLII